MHFILSYPAKGQVPVDNVLTIIYICDTMNHHEQVNIDMALNVLGVFITWVDGMGAEGAALLYVSWGP